MHKTNLLIDLQQVAVKPTKKRMSLSFTAMQYMPMANAHVTGLVL